MARGRFAERADVPAPGAAGVPAGPFDDLADAASVFGRGSSGGLRVGSWATAAAGDVPCRVVLAHREYEAWFLAAIESLRGRRAVKSDADPHPAPESPRGAKEQLESACGAAPSYLETVDQPAFSAVFSLSSAYR